MAKTLEAWVALALLGASIIIIGMILLTGSAHGKIACIEAPDGTAARWAWRMVESRKCWFKGVPKQYDRDDLYWPAPPAAPKTVDSEKEAAPEEVKPVVVEPPLDPVIVALLEHGQRRVNEMEFEAMEARALAEAQAASPPVMARSIERNIDPPLAAPIALSTMLTIAAAACLTLGFLAAMWLGRAERPSSCL